MTPPPAESALPRCPFCGQDTALVEYGRSRETARGYCGECGARGTWRVNEPDEATLYAEAIAAFTRPAHALAESQAECERLRKELRRTWASLGALLDAEDPNARLQIKPGARLVYDDTLSLLIESGAAALSTAQRGGSHAS